MPLSANLRMLNELPQGQGDFSWCELNVNSRWNLADVLGALDMHGLSGKPMKRTSGTSVATEREVASRGAAILHDAPDEIHGLLTRLRSPSESARHLQTMNEAWPGLLRLVKKQVSDEAFGWFCLRLNDHISSSADDGSGVIWRKRAQQGASGAGAVAARLGVRVERLPHLVAACGLQPRSRETAAGRTVRAFDSREAWALKEHIEDHQPARQVTAQFGLSRERLSVLVGFGLLRAIGPRFSVTSVRHLFARIAELPASNDQTGTLDAPYVSLAEALRTQVPQAATGDFFQAAVSGAFAIRLVKTAPQHVRDFMIHQPAVATWLAGHSSGANGLTIADAAKQLGVKQEVAYHLVRIGLLRAVKRQVGRRTARVVGHTDLSHFQAEVRPLAALAKEKGVGARGAVAWARSNGLAIVSGPEVDGGRQYFVRLCQEPSTVGGGRNQHPPGQHKERLGLGSMASGQDAAIGTADAKDARPKLPPDGNQRASHQSQSLTRPRKPKGQK